MWVYWLPKTMPETTRERSRQLSERAKEAIPGGVNSYARKFDRTINFA